MLRCKIFIIVSCLLFMFYPSVETFVNNCDISLNVIREVTSYAHKSCVASNTVLICEVTFKHKALKKMSIVALNFLGCDIMIC